MPLKALKQSKKAENNISSVALKFSRWVPLAITPPCQAERQLKTGIQVLLSCVAIIYLISYARLICLVG